MTAFVHLSMFDKPTQPQPTAMPPAGAPGGTPAPAPDVTGHPILDKPTAVESGRLQPIQTPPAPPSPRPLVATPPPAQLSGPVLSPSKSHRAKWVVLLIVVVALLGALGVWVFTLNQPSEADEIKEPVKTETTTPPVVVDADSDNDGLMDSKERELGTAPNNPDSDNDGLTDNEEVTLWNTDPLIEDTDKDGYADGAEVNNGYNPAGPGKLFNVDDVNL